ncbi:cytochrome P450 2J4-like [Engraulis encrasicolus]|uniref:cytochrome P450 2J4-like n=1 Tax=Engraulis encrasicolus TaxID=184585 RepID=UPI002FD528FB
MRAEFWATPLPGPGTTDGFANPPVAFPWSAVPLPSPARSTLPQTKTSSEHKNIMITTALGALWHHLVAWVDLQGTLVFLSVLIMAKYLKDFPHRDLPPGPVPLPLVGSLFSIGFKDPIGGFRKLVETYGDVSFIDLGFAPCILLSGYKSFKEAFVEQAEHFTDRPDYPLAQKFCKGLGIIASSGNIWKHQRRFALATLKYFGVGKKTLERSIQQESQYLIETLQLERGLPFNPKHLMTNSVANIICMLVFGHRFEYSDHDFQHLLKCSDEVFQLPMTTSGRLYNQWPTLMQYLPGGHQSAFANLTRVKQFIQQEVDRHREDRNPDSPRDYIDCYLDEIEKCTDPSAGFTEENLMYCVVDLFGAGTETTANSMRWALLFMANHPDVQEKVHSEIDRVIGPSRQPSMDDRAALPYTYAVVHEIQRCGNIVPFTPPRVASRDTTVAGRQIPKGLVILPMLKPILYDVSEYSRPEEFNPSHFLDEDGKFIKRDNFIPFGIGKRACPGEQLARMELFLFFTSLMQRFSFQAPEGETLVAEGVVGITSGPKPFKICATPR